MDHIDRIVAATHRRRVLIVDYAGRAPGKRTIHPHAVYLSGLGTPIVEGLQVAGVTNTRRLGTYALADRRPGPSAGGGPWRELPAWRALRIDLIEDAEMTADGFEISHLFNPAVPRYKNLIARCPE